MIRLRVSGVEEATERDGARRLRGATVEARADAAWDAVAFVGPAPPEEAVAEQALAAGKHVLLAAEACLPGAALARLAAAARRHAVQLAAVNPDHHLPSCRLIRQQLDAGRLGETACVRLHRWEPAAGGRAEPPAPLVRDLELTLWFLGRPPDRVYAVGRDAPPGRFVQAHLGFPGGGMALLDYCDRLPPGDGYHSLSVIGTAGAAYADDHQNMQLVFGGGRPAAVRTDEGARALADLLQEFVDGLRDGRDLTAGVAAWQHAWAAADAVRRSLQSRQAIPLRSL